MRTIIFLITFSLVCCSTFGQQSPDNIIKTEIGKLELSNSSFLIMKEYCIGSERIYPGNTKCNVEEYPFDIYIIWIENNQTKLAKFDNCGVYETEITSKIENPWIFLNTNLERIKLAKVLPYALKDNSFMAVDHSCQFNFIIQINGQRIENSFDEFNLTNEKENENLNFKSNNSLEIVKLKNLILNLNQSVLKK